MERALSYLWLAFVSAGIVVVAWFIHFIVFAVLQRLVKKTPYRFDKHLLTRMRKPMQILFILFALRALLPLYDPILPEVFAEVSRTAMYIAFMALGAWMIIKALFVAEDTLLERYRVETKDNLAARRIHTQFGVFKRLGIIVIVVIFLSIALMRFETFRHVGTGILASVGVMGIVIGFAAQRTVGTLLAGIQIAISQPIRLDDVVIVDNEWGRIEEINFTYVVVRIWDARRLVVPTPYFLEHPFQNWTKTTAEMLGTVFLYVDYRFPVDDLRKKLHEILQQSRWWDGRGWALQVTDSRETTMELRALMSSEDSPTAWELRCEVREKLIDYIQRTYPEYLPRFRISTDPKESIRREPA